MLQYGFLAGDRRRQLLRVARQHYTLRAAHLQWVSLIIGLSRMEYAIRPVSWASLNLQLTHFTAT